MNFKNNTSKAFYAVLCVVLSVLLVGGIIFIVALGNKYENRDFDFDQGAWEDRTVTSETEDTIDTYANKDVVESQNGSDGMRTQQLSISAISYEIDVPYGNVGIYPTDKEDVYVEYSDNRDIGIALNESNGVLKIKVKMPKQLSQLLDIDKDKYKVNFYLPKEGLDKLDIDLNAGNLNIRGIKADRLEIDVDAGNCVIKECEVDKFEADINAGNFEFQANPEISTVSMDVDAGNAKLLLPKDIKGFNLAYDVDLGNFNDKSSFNAHSSNSGVISKKGVFNYGDGSCQVKIDINVGNFSLDSY